MCCGCAAMAVRQPLSALAIAGYATAGCLWLIALMKDLGLTVRLGRLPNSYYVAWRNVRWLGKGNCWHNNPKEIKEECKPWIEILVTTLHNKAWGILTVVSLITLTPYFPQYWGQLHQYHHFNQWVLPRRLLPWWLAEAFSRNVGKVFLISSWYQRTPFSIFRSRV